MLNVEGQNYTAEEMLSANSDDADLCAWINVAKIGESFPALISCTRIS